MQACNAHSLHCVPLYETLGAGAVKYIICHTEISIIFAEETKISEGCLYTILLLCFLVSEKKISLSFSTITNEQKQKQKQMAETCGLELYSWETFLHLGTLF
ncbi:putative long-chain-fatty-acid--CoA ligase [Helianthus annuus]|uniref:Long-chain-fatty-acid--CoA ligase n=1 Tax=Helianthus annuus TaxID=4232 RepID=A0A251UUB0_HELAN|nr:putative long-chain-fatty-acid--CoA ligase [Helianthus annuus]